MCLAIPGKIVALNGRTAKIDFNGITRNAQIFSEAKVGEYALVHAGFVLEIIDEKRADEIITILKEKK